MSVRVESTVVPPGDDRYVDEAWSLKERIRTKSGVLKQRKRFFAGAYQSATNRLILTTDDEQLVGFASTRDSGYLLFLAVDPDYQGMGFGRELVTAVATEHDVVTCHARVTNDVAIGFYENLGFEIVRRIGNYYEDGGDAYYLKLGESISLSSRILSLFGS